MYAVTRHILITFPIFKELYLFFFFKWQTRLFKLYEAIFIYKNLAADDYWLCLLGLGLVKDLTFSNKSWFVCNSKHFHQNMTPYYSCYFCLFYIFNFFQIILGSLFFACHDQYLLMFKESNVFGFTNFSSQTKHNNTAAFPVNSNYLFSRRKQEKKLLKQFFD